MRNPVEIPTPGLVPFSPVQAESNGETVDETVGAENVLAEILAEILQREQVSRDSNFFQDLGADSMVMAQFCARVRKRTELPSVSMKDIYRHPTVKGLAIALTESASDPAVSPASVRSHAPDRSTVATADRTAVPTEATGAGPVEPGSTRQFVGCGVLQFLIFLGASYLSAQVIILGFEWVSAAKGLTDIYQRSMVFSGSLFLGTCTLPILAKWTLIGRWQPQQLRIWSLAYVRFWLVKTLVASNPLVLFAGSPLYVLYLRALGAKVGRGVVILSRHLPVCTDLLTIGDGTVVRKDSFLTCYRARAGMIETGPVTLGRDVFVGEQTVLDIDTSMGDGSQLGHASCLHAGQAVPGGEHWHGSPGQRTEADYRGAAPAHCSSWRRARYSLLQLLSLVFYLPLGFGFLTLLLTEVPWLATLLGPYPLAIKDWVAHQAALAASLVLFFGGLLVRFLVVMTVPRVLNLAIKPDRVYPLYGIHYVIHRTIARMTNNKFFHTLTGDSSFIAYYLVMLGYKLSPLVQTGSNFGNQVKHENPYLSGVGSGTVVASGLSVINADYSSTSFRVTRASIGSQNFLGNQIAYPWQGRTGDDCLLATKVLVPIDGEVREGVGLLGSPSFEIPRTVERDTKFYHLASGDGFHRRLATKNRYNLATAGWFLLARWFYTFLLMLIALGGVDLYAHLGALAFTGSSVLILTVSVAYFSFVERASTRFRGCRPTYCSIYQIDFWRVERFFKLVAGTAVHRIANGTPLKPILYRLVGVRVGRRLFDDGSGMSEKNMVTIGDDVTLNAGSFIQCHSQEDYAFKSDNITIGNGCTVGVGALVHYGVTMGDGAALAPDSFLMKGEEMPANAHWGGNPARELTAGRTESANAVVRRVFGG